ncbi:MAG: acyl-[acyl-carrier-protein] thioesterase [Candidatus Cyclobacteriaceae bacterium M3_2C_046]
MENAYLTENFNIRANETGPNQMVTMPALANFFQEAAWNHSMALGASFYDLMQHGLTWVLSRLAIEIIKQPKFKDEIRIKTWPSGYDRYYVFRDFLVLDSDHQVIGQAKSHWVVFDFKNRKVADIPSFIKDIKISADLPEIPAKTEKIPSLEHYQHQQEFQSGWHDIDFNMHVNNLSYIRWVMESVPIEVLKAARIREIDLVFRSEAVLGQHITGFSQPDQQKGVFWHKLKGAHPKELVLAKTVWE